MRPVPSFLRSPCPRTTALTSPAPRRPRLAAGLRVKVVVVFEENDTSASKYSKKERPDFQRLIELIRQNRVNAIFATEVERLVRQPAEAEQLINLAGVTDLREIHLTSEEGYD